MTLALLKSEFEEFEKTKAERDEDKRTDEIELH